MSGVYHVWADAPLPAPHPSSRSLRKAKDLAPLVSLAHTRDRPSELHCRHHAGSGDLLDATLDEQLLQSHTHDWAGAVPQAARAATSPPWKCYPL